MQVLDVAAGPRHAGADSVRKNNRREILATRARQVARGDMDRLALMEAWSRRVRRVGGLIQLAFAVFWLLRGAGAFGGRTADLLMSLALLAGAAAFRYAVKATAGKAARPQGPQAKHIEKSITIATVLEFLAAFVLPLVVISSGHSDWVLPSIAITLGPLLLYLGHLVQIARYRIVGWALTVGPLVLVASLSGSALVATTGLASGLLLLATAVAGFRDLAVLDSGTSR